MRSETLGRAEILGSHGTRTEIVGPGDELGRAEIAGWVDDGTVQHEILGRAEIAGFVRGGTVQHEILGREEILGRDEILGALEEIVGRSWSPARAAQRATRRAQGGGRRRHRQHDGRRYQQPGAPAQAAPGTTPPYQPLSPGYGQQAYQAPSSSYYPQDYYQQEYYPPESPQEIYVTGLEEILGAFVGDDELALAAEGGAAERESLERRTGRRGRLGPPSPERLARLRERAASGDERAQKKLERLQASSSSGSNAKWQHAQLGAGEVAAELLEELKTRAAAGDERAKKALAKIRERASTSGAELTDQQRAREILSAAAAAKKIARPDLKQAIWLYAGRQSTEKERTAVGRKMFDFLAKRGIALT